MWTKAFWLAAGERGISTFAQVLAAKLVLVNTPLLDVGWTEKLSVASLSGIASILMYVSAHRGNHLAPPAASQLDD